MNNEKLNITEEWDKVFSKSDKVDHKKITFHNRYGITLVADMYIPKNVNGKLPAIAVSGPFGAVKEQSSGLYAQEMAERGYLTIAFDPSFTGESGGVNGIRDVASLDLNVEDFMASIDYLSNLDNVDLNKIGIIGICGWGGMALGAGETDPRIKAIVTSTMYDMHRVADEGYFHSSDSKEARNEIRKNIATQRTEDYKNGKYKFGGGTINPNAENVPFFVHDYAVYYKTKRGYNPRSVNSNNGWTITSSLSLLNFPLLTYTKEMATPVLMIHGEKAHSLYFSKVTYENMTGEQIELDTVHPNADGSFYIPSGMTEAKIFKNGNKELYVVPDANHTDLYDNKAKIPFDRIDQFFKENL